MHDDELLRLVPGERRSRVVHIRRRFEERNVLRAKPNRRGLGLLLRAPGAAVALRELVSDEEADVVAGTLVGATQVAEAHDDGRIHAGIVEFLLVWFLVGLRTGAEGTREPKVGDS